jgi:hypothetical protein
MMRIGCEINQLPAPGFTEVACEPEAEAGLHSGPLSGQVVLCLSLSPRLCPAEDDRFSLQLRRWHSFHLRSVDEANNKRKILTVFYASIPGTKLTGHSCTACLSLLMSPVLGCHWTNHATDCHLAFISETFPH